MLLMAVGTTVISHIVFNRSLMATVVEGYIRISGTKDKFEDADKYADFIEERAQANEETYEIPKSVDFNVEVDESDYQGMQTYYVNESEDANYMVVPHILCKPS